MGGIGRLSTEKSIENAIREIREWLAKIGVSGLGLNLQYDPKLNVALCRFSYQGKTYEFRSTKQKNCRLNMHAISRVMEAKVRAQLMGIEDFTKAMQAYLLLEGSTDQSYAPQNANVDEVPYAVLGITPLASNEELVKRHRELVKTFHPDMALSAEAKKEFERRSSEINAAWTAIRKERGI